MRIKRITGIILTALLLCMASGCGKSGQASTGDRITAEENTDTEDMADQTAENKSENGTVSQEDDIVDLTVLSSTLVYAEVFNMMAYPEKYQGKTIKMEGTFAIYEGEERNYYACIVADATACCTQGIEFVCTEDYIYPEDYPEAGAEIVVQGVFDLYEEDGFSYLQLVDAVMDEV